MGTQNPFLVADKANVTEASVRRTKSAEQLKGLYRLCEATRLLKVLAWSDSVLTEGECIPCCLNLAMYKALYKFLCPQMFCYCHLCRRFEKYT
ncbi:unnamed protein product [Prunus brigantina]